MAKDASRPPKLWPWFSALTGETPQRLGLDLVAGLTLAAIAIPEQMATARLGGFAPEVGLFAFAAASLGFAIFGSNRRLSAGGDSTITPIFAGSIALIAVAGSSQYAESAAVLAIMVGVLLLIGGVFRLGWIADLLSMPVLTGFLAGIALHIVLSQAPSILGLPEGSGNIYQRMDALGGEMGHIKPASIAIGLGVFAVIFVAEKISGRIPGALIAVVGATLATRAWHLDAHGVAVLGHIGGGVPRFQPPHLEPGNALSLVGLALVVAVVVMVQTAATTRAFSGDDGESNVAGDFLGLGVGNVIAGLFGTFPVNASPPRTAIAAEAGARSQYAGLLAAAAVLLLAAFGTPLLAHVPVAALGGIMLFVAQRIFHLRVFIKVLRHTPAEFALALATMVLIVALPIQSGVAIGIFLSLAHGVFTITRARLTVFERLPGTTVWWPATAAQPGETVPGVVVMGFQAPLSFLNADDFRRDVMGAISNSEMDLLVLEASSIVEIDFTAAEVLSQVIAKVRAAGADFAVARLESVRAQDAFERFGVTDCLGPGHLFQSVEEAIRTLVAQPRFRESRRARGPSKSTGKGPIGDATL